MHVPSALRNHVDSEDQAAVSIQHTPGGEQQLTVINESGLYALIFGSQLPAAREFKRWVTNEVLPSIRRTGYYEIRHVTCATFDQFDIGYRRYRADDSLEE